MSRHTVREAVRHLKAQGVIEPERGRGSFVRQVDIAQEVGTLLSLVRGSRCSLVSELSDTSAVPPPMVSIDDPA